MVLALATAAGTAPAWAQAPTAAPPTAAAGDATATGDPAEAAPTAEGPSASLGVGGGLDGADVAQEDESDSLPPRVPWRASFAWGHSATTTALGVGRDNLGSSHEAYLMNWKLTLQYYLVNEDIWTLNVATAPNVMVELTNSDYTTTEREPWFDDLPLGATLGLTLFESDEKDFITSASLGEAFIFPTSPASSAVGTYLTTSTTLGLSQTFPLAKDAPVFTSMALSLGGSWNHRFGEATTAVAEDLDRPRQTSTGVTYLSDQLTGSPIADNTVVGNVTLAFPQEIAGMELVLLGGMFGGAQFQPELEGSECEVQILTGCVQAASEEDVRTSQNFIGFLAMLAFAPVSEAGLTIGYANKSAQLGPDGQRRSLFYSPDAVFSANLIVSLDAIYEGLTGPRRSGSVLMAKQEKRERRARSGAAITF